MLYINYVYKIDEQIKPFCFFVSQIHKIIEGIWNLMKNI